MVIGLPTYVNQGYFLTFWIITNEISLDWKPGGRRMPKLAYGGRGGQKYCLRSLWMSPTRPPALPSGAGSGHSRRGFGGRGGDDFYINPVPAYQCITAIPPYDDMLHKQYNCLGTVTIFFRPSWKKSGLTMEFLAWQGRVKCVNWHECQCDAILEKFGLIERTFRVLAKTNVSIFQNMDQWLPHLTVGEIQTSRKKMCASYLYLETGSIGRLLIKKKTCPLFLKKDMSFYFSRQKERNTICR